MQIAQIVEHGMGLGMPRRGRFQIGNPVGILPGLSTRQATQVQRLHILRSDGQDGAQFGLGAHRIAALQHLDNLLQARRHLLAPCRAAEHIAQDRTQSALAAARRRHRFFLPRLAAPGARHRINAQRRDRRIETRQRVRIGGG